VVFSAGTTAPVLYAYDAASGKRLAELPLPVTAQATPMSYELDGKQYVVVSAGGHGPLGLPQGDALVAFALP
jgi:quinoprotein glucose dehydrogenase